MSDDQLGTRTRIESVRRIDFDRIDHLVSQARAERRAEIARFEMLQSIVAHLPGSAMFVVGRDDHGEMYIEVAEGGAFRGAGHKADDVLGKPLRLFVEPGSDVWRGYLSAFEGQPARAIHESRGAHFVTIFGPLDEPGRAVRFVIALTLNLGDVFGDAAVSKLLTP